MGPAGGRATSTPALPCPGCDFVKDKASDAAASVAGNALEEFANAVKEDVGRVVAEVGTVWMRVPTVDPLATDGGTAPSVTPGSAPGGGSGIVEVLGMVSWVTLAVCVLSLMIAGARMGIESRRNDGEYHMTRLMTILIGAVLVSAAAGIATALMPERSSGTATVAFIENSLWYYTAAAVVLSVLIGALRLAWEQRAEPGKDLLRSLLTFVAVSGAGLTVISILLASGDAFSRWIISNSLDCKSEKDAACFGENISVMLGVSGASGLGVIAVIVLGLMAFVAACVQVGMMVARSGMLIILSGTLSLSASATNTTVGRQMFQKTVGWIVALLLYKPIAAIIYAAGFQLVGSDVLGGGLGALGQVIVGLMMMVLALVALPALMRLITPAVGALASGNAAGGMAMAAAAGVASGAVHGGQLFGGGSSPIGEIGSSATGADGGPSGSSSGSGSGSSGGGGPSGSSAAGDGSGSESGGEDLRSVGGGESVTGASGGGESGSESGEAGSGAGSMGGSPLGGGGASGAGAGGGLSGAGESAGASEAAAAAGGPAALAAGAAAGSGGDGGGLGGKDLGDVASGAVSSAAGAARNAAGGAADVGAEGVGEQTETENEEGPSGSR